jgi:hypothetical protein
VRLAAVLFGLESVIVRVEVPPAAMVAGAKPFATLGATAFTVRLAVAGLALLPFEVCSAPAAMVFV